jgi:hypothetical protein
MYKVETDWAPSVQYPRNEDTSTLLQMGHFLLYLFIFPVGRQRMGTERRHLKIKNSDPPGGPPAKRRRLMEEEVATKVPRRNLKLKNTNPLGGPPPKRQRMSEDDLGYPVCVCGESCEDILVIDIDEETVRLRDQGSFSLRSPAEREAVTLLGCIYIFCLCCTL